MTQDTSPLTPVEQAALQGRLTALLGRDGTPADPAALAEQVAAALAGVLAERAPAPVATGSGRNLAFETDPTRRVVITGMGALTALGLNVDDTWAGMIAGRSGVGPITRFDSSLYPTHIAAEINGFDPTVWLDRKEVRRMSRPSQLIGAAAHMALADSGLPIPEGGADDVGAFVGSGCSSLPETEETMRLIFKGGGLKVSPFFVGMSLPNMPAGQLGITYGLRGPNATVSSACAASNTSIGEAAEMIRRGAARAMLAGGVEAPVCEFGLASFSATRAMSTRNDDPQGACRPFAGDRDGMVAGEGAGILILERLDYALARGAHIYAEVIGYGASCDAYHIVAPDSTGRGAALAIGRALASTGLAPEDIEYINGHGTATDLNDAMETRAVKTVFGDTAYKIPISVIKPMVGHLLAGCGAVEAVTTVKALETGILPPTINHHVPDPV
ncbi:MAG TPA: beta-ketoacyl-[acyl-carrier-protein] synthase II, partial [Chloroflexia bacterium]|nr:beta-ketoacyl-[acyl-carrier-protein] synthase II [Chloroflexia bacterium]